MDWNKPAHVPKTDGNPKNNEYENSITSQLAMWEHTLLSVKSTSSGNFSHLNSSTTPGTDAAQTQIILNTKIGYLLTCTLKTIFSSDWSTVSTQRKMKLKTQVQTAAYIVTEPAVLRRILYTLEIFLTPWEHNFVSDVLNKIDLSMHKEKQCMLREGNLLIFLRLVQLCQTGCYDLALNWIDSYFRVLDEPENTFYDTLTENAYNTLFVLYCALLIKFCRESDVIIKLKKISASDAIKILNNCFENVNYKNCNLKKYKKKLSRLILNVIIAREMVKEIATETEKQTFNMFIFHWISTNIQSKDFESMLKKFIDRACSGLHLYLVYNTLKIIDANNLHKYLALEIYIRAINADLNRFEILKLNPDVNEDALISEEINLSSKYVNLSDMFAEYLIIKCECLLTAFSLNPNFDNYRRIMYMVEAMYNDLAARRASASTSTDAKLNGFGYSTFENNGPKQILSDECIESILSGRAFEAVISVDTVNRMGQDLITILSAPRNKLLVWSMSWPELNANCLNLLSNEKKMGLLRMSTINAKQELKFINIDYNDFKHLPCAETPGIEKGYEQYMDSDYDEDEEEDGGGASNTDNASEDIDKTARRKRRRPAGGVVYRKARSRKPRNSVSAVNALRLNKVPYYHDEELVDIKYEIGCNVEVPYDNEKRDIDTILLSNEINVPYVTDLDSYLSSDASPLPFNQSDDDYNMQSADDIISTPTFFDSGMFFNNESLRDHYSYCLRRISSFEPPPPPPPLQQLPHVDDFKEIPCDSNGEVSLQTIEPSLKVQPLIKDDDGDDAMKDSMIEIRLLTEFVGGDEEIAKEAVLNAEPAAIESIKTELESLLKVDAAAQINGLSEIKADELLVDLNENATITDLGSISDDVPLADIKTDELMIDLNETITTPDLRNVSDDVLGINGLSEIKTNELMIDLNETITTPDLRNVSDDVLDINGLSEIKTNELMIGLNEIETPANLTSVLDDVPQMNSNGLTESNVSDDVVDETIQSLNLSADAIPDFNVDDFEQAIVQFVVDKPHAVVISEDVVSNDQNKEPVEIFKADVSDDEKQCIAEVKLIDETVTNVSICEDKSVENVNEPSMSQRASPITVQQEVEPNFTHDESAEEKDLNSDETKPIEQKSADIEPLISDDALLREMRSICGEEDHQSKNVEISTINENCLIALDDFVVNSQNDCMEVSIDLADNIDVNASDNDVINETIEMSFSSSLSTINQDSACPSMEVSEDDEEDKSSEVSEIFNESIKTIDIIEPNLFGDDEDIKGDNIYDNNLLPNGKEDVESASLSPFVDDDNFVRIHNFEQFNLGPSISRDDARILPDIILERCSTLPKIPKCIVQLHRMTNAEIRAHTHPKIVLVRKYKEWTIGKPIPTPLRYPSPIVRRKPAISLKRWKYRQIDLGDVDYKPGDDIRRNFKRIRCKEYIEVDTAGIYSTDYSDDDDDGSWSCHSSQQSQSSWTEQNSQSSSQHEMRRLMSRRKSAPLLNGLIEKLSQKSRPFMYVALKREKLITESPADNEEIGAGATQLTKVYLQQPNNDDEIAAISNHHTGANVEIPFKWMAKNIKTYSRTTPTNTTNELSTNHNHQQNFRKEGSHECKFSNRCNNQRCEAPSSDNRTKTATASSTLLDVKLNVYLNRHKRRRVLQDLNGNNRQNLREIPQLNYKSKLDEKLMSTKKTKCNFFDRIPGMCDNDFLKVASKLRNYTVQVVEISKLVSKGETESKSIEQLKTTNHSSQVTNSLQIMAPNVTAAAATTATSSSAKSEAPHIVKFLCRTNGRKIQLTPISKTPTSIKSTTPTVLTSTTSTVMNDAFRAKVFCTMPISSSIATITASTTTTPPATTYTTIPRINQVFWSKFHQESSTNGLATINSEEQEPKLIATSTATPLSTTVIGTPTIFRLAPNTRKKYVQLSSVKLTPQATQFFASNASNKSAITTVDNSTLEQLKEFDMVYEQVKGQSETVTTPPLTQKQTAPPAIVVLANYRPVDDTTTATLTSKTNVIQVNTVPAVVTGASALESPRKSAVTTVVAPQTKSPQKSHEDEQTVQRIHNILAGYAEQIRNSPDLKNKPAPRKRSNLLSSPSSIEQNIDVKSVHAKRKKISKVSSLDLRNHGNQATYLGRTQKLEIATVTTTTVPTTYVTSSAIMSSINQTTHPAPRQLLLQTTMAESSLQHKKFTSIQTTSATLSSSSSSKSVNYIVPINFVKIISATNGTKIIQNPTNNAINFTSNLSPVIMRANQQQQHQPQSPPIIVVTCNKSNNNLPVAATKTSVITTTTSQAVVNGANNIHEAKIATTTAAHANNDFLILEEDEKSQFNDQFLNMSSSDKDDGPGNSVKNSYHIISSSTAAEQRKQIVQAEYEDLGVDEPSTNDLFPEADIFFDVNTTSSSIDVLEGGGSGGNKTDSSDQEATNLSNSFFQKKKSQYKNYSKCTDKDKRKIAPSFHRRLKFTKKSLKFELRKYNVASSTQRSSTVGEISKRVMPQQTVGTTITTPITYSSAHSRCHLNKKPALDFTVSQKT